ncbi:MAG: hypothetical protein MZW92_36605 [Comamonadaceae bacterium]|nr:hypothetical protein [Comamonadaceae bacterium]
MPAMPPRTCSATPAAAMASSKWLLDRAAARSRAGWPTTCVPGRRRCAADSTGRSSPPRYWG